MSDSFCLSVTFLDPEAACHGRREGADLEWPPSPLRLYQALLASTAARWPGALFQEYGAPALRWLERQAAPVILTPAASESQPYRLSIPNNNLDVAAAAWARGNVTSKDAQPSTHRAMKTVRAIRLMSDAVVHYLWRLPEPWTDEVRGYVETLASAARHLTALGWGIDLVAGHGRLLSQAEAEQLVGERWRPGHHTDGTILRVPRRGTFEALVSRHRSFLNRVDDGGFTPVPILSTFDRVSYHPDSEPARRPCAAFALLRPDAGGFRPFEPTRWTAAVSGMVRHAVALAAQEAGWERDRINTYVHGHTPDGAARARGEDADRRFAYLPLPTINPRRVENIRRVLVVGPPGADDEIAWVRRAVSARELNAEGQEAPIALLSLIALNDRNIRWYMGPARAWSTVTSVVLPGHDEGNAVKGERLLRRAFVQAGMAPELVAAADLRWRRVGYRPGVDLATRYERPHQTRFPRYHVWVRWPKPIHGPLFVGAVRYRGLGVFAAETL